MFLLVCFPLSYPLILSCSQGVWENNFVDAQFLQAAWPQELDNVRLLIVFCSHDGHIYTHDWNLFTPRAKAQECIDAGQEWTGRDVILKLQNGHFTILRPLPENDHPIQDMLNKMIHPEVELPSPGERQLLHLESIFGGDPDPARVKSISQLYSEVMQAGFAVQCAVPAALHVSSSDSDSNSNSNSKCDSMMDID